MRLALYPLLLLFSLYLPGTWAGEPPLEIEGQWRQGHLLWGKTAPGSQVLFEGRAIPLAEDGTFLLGLDRDAPEQVSLQISGAAGEVLSRNFAVQQRDYQIQRIEGIKKKHMAPDPKQLARVTREAKAIKQARAPLSDLQHFREQFQWPVLGPISGVYGSQRYYNGVPKRPHYGVDVARPKGTPFVAPAGGKVIFAHPDTFYSGGLIILDHGHGLSSAFLHLSAVQVEVGQEIKKGQQLGLIGATGRVTGPHLDWRMNWFKAQIDPTTLVPPMEMALKAQNLAANSFKAPK